MRGNRGDTEEERVVMAHGLIKEAKCLASKDINRMLTRMVDWSVVVPLICSVQIHVGIRVQQEVLYCQLLGSK